MIDHNNILGKDIDLDVNNKTVFFVSSLILDFRNYNKTLLIFYPQN